jgi:hypothetical protein
VPATLHWGASADPLLPLKSNTYCIYRVYVCGRSYPACKAHAPYCHLWSVWLCNIFQHYLINRTILEKKVMELKCVFSFSLSCLFEIFFIQRRI